MSTLKTTYLQHPSSVTPNLELNADGTVTVLPNGLLQVVQTVKTDIFSTSSASYTAVTGFSVTITPSSLSNKILLLANFIAGHVPDNNDQVAFFRLTGGNLATFIGDSASSRERVAFSTKPNRASGPVYPGDLYFTAALTYLDSPATTSPVTYGLEARIEVGGTVRVNASGRDENASYYARTPSSITAIEIAG